MTVTVVPRPGALVHGDLAAVGVDRGVGDRQAEPAAAPVAGAGRVGPVEALGHPGGHVRGHALPVVDRPRCGRPLRPVRPASSIGVVAGVWTTALPTMLAMTWRRRSSSPDTTTGPLSSVVIGRPGSTAARIAGGVGDEPAEVDRRAGRADVPRRAWPAEQVVDQPGHAHRLLLGAPHRLVELAPGPQAADAVQLGVAPDRRHRRAQLVGRVGHEPPQPLLRLRPLRERRVEPLEHVVEGHAELAGLGRRRHLRHPLARGRRRRSAPRCGVICLIGRIPRRTTHHATAASSSRMIAVATTSSATRRVIVSSTSVSGRAVTQYGPSGPWPDSHPVAQPVVALCPDRERLP